MILPSQITEAHKALISERDAVMAALRIRPAATEPRPDAMDAATEAAEQALGVSACNRNSRHLADVNAALLRIDDGEYGMCVDCEEEISPRRLRAVPWAARCVSCQEIFELNTTSDPLESERIDGYPRGAGTCDEIPSLSA